MLNVLVIANQQRLQQIVATAASLPGVSVRVATSLDEASAEIPQFPPSIIFLQGRLSGLSPEIVTRHVKNEVGAHAATIVLLAESIDACAETQANIVLDTSLSDVELQSSIEHLLAEQLPVENAALPASGSTKAKERKSKDGVKEKVSELGAAKKTASPASRKPAASRKQKIEATTNLHQELDEIFGNFHQELATILNTSAEVADAKSLSPHKKPHATSAKIEDNPPKERTVGGKANKREEAILKAVPTQEGPVMPPRGQASSDEPDSTRQLPGLHKSATPASPESVGDSPAERKAHGFTPTVLQAVPSGPPIIAETGIVEDPAQEERDQLAHSSLTGVSVAGEPLADPAAVAEHFPEAVHDTITIAGAATSGDTQENHTDPPVKFQEELDSLLGTNASPRQADTVTPQGAPALHGPTVEEMMRNPPATSRTRVSWPVFCIAALLVAVGLYYLSGLRPGSRKIADSPAASRVKSPAVQPAPPQVPPAPPQQTATVTAPVAGSTVGTAREELKPGPGPAGKPAQASAPPSMAPEAPASMAASPTTDRIVKTALPSFIPEKALVRSGSRSDSERYMTPTAEFRVFREKKAIKALQVIDRSGKGLSRPFFSKTIQEMAGVRDYQLESKETKGKYLVKKGKLSGNAHVILYKKNADTMLQAFVIYYQ